MGNKQREGIRRTALECLEHYQLIIRRIRNLCADFDSKDLIDPGSMALQLRLSEGEANWYAPIGDSKGAQNLLTTKKWLEELIFKTGSITFTRLKLIKVIADKEGGAHLDPNIDPEYYEIARANGAGWTFFLGDGQEISLGDPFPALLRQLCYEVLMTDARLRNEGWMWRVETRNQVDGDWG